MTVHGACSRGISHREYSPARSGWPSITTSRLNLMRVAESAPGCQTLSHGTSAPNSARPRATGRPYSIEMLVNATIWLTVPRWLNGYPCADDTPGAKTQANAKQAIV